MAIRGGVNIELQEYPQEMRGNSWGYEFSIKEIITRRLLDEYESGARTILALAGTWREVQYGVIFNERDMDLLRLLC